MVLNPLKYPSVFLRPTNSIKLDVQPMNQARKWIPQRTECVQQDRHLLITFFSCLTAFIYKLVEIKVNLSNVSWHFPSPSHKCKINAHFLIISLISRMRLLFFWLLNCYRCCNPFRMFASLTLLSLNNSLSVISQAWSTSFSTVELLSTSAWQAIKVFISAENLQFRNMPTTIRSYQIAN